MFDLEAYKQRFAESGLRVFEHAMEETRRRAQNYISVEHILNALAEEEADLFNAILRDLAVNPREFKTLVEKRIDSGLQHRGEGIRIAPEMTNCFRRAMERARAQGRQTIEATDLFMALSQHISGLFVEIMRSFDAAPEAVVESVRSHVYMKEVVLARVRPNAQQHDLIGKMVRIKSGPFASFPGKVVEVSEEDSKLVVMVEIFGRLTPVELRFDDIERITFEEGH